jgi:hypothetical protein
MIGHFGLREGADIVMIYLPSPAGKAWWLSITAAPSKGRRDVQPL